MSIKIYTDGACSGNPGIGGWGAIIFFSDNNYVELNLVLKRDIDNKSMYREWDGKERWAAQQALNSALDILDEYHY